MGKLKLIFITIVAILFVISSISCGAKNITEQKENTNNSNNAPAVPQNVNTEQPPQPQPSPVPAAEKKDETPKGTVIGSYRTNILDKDEDRTKNIELAVEEVNGYTVQPGEVFSFNAVVGKRNAAKGYEKAKIIVNGKRKEGIGGGICQLSTTLYNAVEQAGLEVVERHAHDKEVHYVPLGRDAAVNYGTQDFKFRNTKDYPIVVKASIWKWKVAVSLVKG